MTMNRLKVVAAAVLTVVTASACVTQEGQGSDGLGGAGPALPRVRGFTEGEPVLFVHSEASDADVAGMLTQMMNSPVLHVPALAQAPSEMLATVFVFTNGVAGDGPLGFQGDVFDNPPGSEGYRPLRALAKVSWKDGAKARELRSAAEVADAESAGDLTQQRPGVVINMPLVTWPGGQR